MITGTYEPSTVEALGWFCEQARAPRLRTMAEFAEQEIVLPNGPRMGLHLRISTQPWVGLFLGEVESGRWQAFATTGGRQGGKTLICSQLPVLYHLFEVGETVIYLIPDMELAGYKWTRDLLPVIMRTRYRRFLPMRGAGSKGGKVSEIQFTNGAGLIFMTGGGGDAGRAGRTARVVVVTEVDKLDDAGGGSEETDKISQAIHCTDAYGARRRIYMECTLTTKQGRTWREIEGGSASRIVLHCPLCQGWVEPGREQLVGWQGAESELAAMEGAAWACPACGGTWSEAQRYQANAEAVLAHKGQTVTEAGKVEGPLPRTRTLGFRWSAVNNMFLVAGDVAAEEWRLEREEDDRAKELKEREVMQYLWALPYEDEASLAVYLDSKALLARPRGCKRGEWPEWAAWLTVGVDVGKYGCYWTAVAWDAGARGAVIDYGVAETIAGARITEKEGKGDESEEHIVRKALERFRDEYLAGGWGDRRPDVVLIDSRWQKRAVRLFCREGIKGSRIHAALGWGTTQRWLGGGTYHHPKRPGARIWEEYNLEPDREHGVLVCNVNADYWKSWVHRRLRTAAGAPGSLGLFQVPQVKDHLTFTKHLTNEREVEEFVPGRGMVTRWEQLSRNNHWLDATMLAAVGGHIAGARLMTPGQSGEAMRVAGFGLAPSRESERAAREGVGYRGGDERAFLVTER